MFDFPFRLQIFQCPQLILGRRLIVNPVQLEKSNLLDSQPAETPLARLTQVGRLAVRHPLVRSRPLQSSLRGDHQFFRIRVERFRDNFFAHRRPVGIRRVDKINSQLNRLPKHSNRLRAILRLSPNSLACDSHRAKAQPVNPKIPSDHKISRLCRGALCTRLRCPCALHLWSSFCPWSFIKNRERPPTLIWGLAQSFPFPAWSMQSRPAYFR